MTSVRGPGAGQPSGAAQDGRSCLPGISVGSGYSGWELGFRERKVSEGWADRLLGPVRRMRRERMMAAGLGSAWWQYVLLFLAVAA